MNFKKSTILHRVYQTKQFESFKRYLIRPKWLKNMMLFLPLKALELFFPMSTDNTVYTLNEMKRKIDNGEMRFHSFSKDLGYFSFIIDKNNPFVLICSGGGNNVVCPLIEGFPIAIRLNELGYNAFVCNYSVGKNGKYPNSIDDIAMFYKDVKERFKMTSKQYAICGFSAGGHLAAMMGTKNLGYEKYNIEKTSF